jgi:predicted peptidase
MGGFGTWALAAAYPKRFAAIAPICGGGDPASADRLRGVPTWAFHGADDTIVPAEQSRNMVAALEQAGGDVKLTIYPGVGHNSGGMTYADNRLYDWFLAHRRLDREPGAKAAAKSTPAL